MLAFFKKFDGYNECISIQVAQTWSEGKVTVEGISSTILAQLIADVSSLHNEGEFLTRDKNPQNQGADAYSLR